MSEPFKVLVIDDDFAVAELHRQFVAEHPDFEPVAVAHSVAQAKVQLAAVQPELILLDLYLPDESGLDFLAWLRAEYPHEVAVIAVTADRDLKSVRTARSGGVYHYLVKPFTVKQLHERLSDLAAGWRQLGEGAPVAVDQSMIDAIMGGTTPIPVVGGRGLPKGLAPHTLDRVVAALQGVTGDVSAIELGEAVGISRVSARRYLDYLASIGRVEVTPRYGTTGRPEHRYRMR